MERGAGAADLCRLQRAGVSASVQGLAAAARVAAAAGSHRACSSRCVTAGPAGTSEAVCCFETPDGQRAIEARATVLALGGASWPRLGSDGAWVETLAAKGVTDIAAAAGQLRLHRRLVRRLSRPLRGPAAEGHRAVVWLDALCAAKRSSRAAASRAARSTRCRLNCARRSSSRRRGDACNRPAARSRRERSDRAAVGAARQAIVLEWLRKAAQLSPVGDRPVAGGRDRLRRVAVVAVGGRPRRTDQRRADRTQWHRADRARDLDRRRHRLRRTRCRLHDPPICPASSPPARCWTGKRRPAAICCRRRSRRARRRAGAC